MENGFQNRVLSTFKAYKRLDPQDPLILLPVLNDRNLPLAYLRPINFDYQVGEPDLVPLLTEWRKNNSSFGTGRFEPTPARTDHWLQKQILERGDRLLFIIQDLNGKKIGHLGFSNFDFDSESGQVDAVLSAYRETDPAMLSYCLQTLIRWGQNQLKMKRILLSVFSDNAAAIEFYEKNGFRKSFMRGLYRVTLENETKLELAPEGYFGPIERYYLYMEYKNQQVWLEPNWETLQSLVVWLE